MTKSSPPQDVEALRSSLLGRVARGSLSPEDADLEAESSGLGTLSHLPDLFAQWPTSRPNWTLTMVLAWITWRTFAEVRQWDPRYLEHRRDWGRLDVSTGSKVSAGYALFQRKPPTAAQFEAWGNRLFGPWHGSEGQPTVLQAALAKSARPELWRALQSGDLGAFAIPVKGGARIKVPAWEWADLEMQASPAARDMLCFRQNLRTNVYEDVQFSQRDVLKVWCPHVRSDLDERGDFSITPIVDDEDARSALYQHIAALDLPRCSFLESRQERTRYPRSKQYGSASRMRQRRATQGVVLRPVASPLALQRRRSLRCWRRKNPKGVTT